ncbi:amino acid permease-domain-containing protein [Delphinella strobiligena]|nr:amino acid permease-domain-containing protein [Delphinella strobiligena]
MEGNKLKTEQCKDSGVHETPVYDAPPPFYDSAEPIVSIDSVHLIAIGVSTSTALFVSIGSGLYKGGPDRLFFAHEFCCCLTGCTTNCMAEMAIYMPQNLVSSFWRDDILVAALYAACIFFLPSSSILDVVVVKYHGEADFWPACGKVLLIGIVFMFTFRTMVGGNPEHDAYGFRYWNRPGAFAENVTTGSRTRFELSRGTWGTLRPRVYLKMSSKTMYWRFGVFFVCGALCVGIVVLYNDPTLVGIISGSTSEAGLGAASPYIRNALLVASIFSAGNGYCFCANRSLYGLALDGKAPRMLRKCTKNGISIFCLAITICCPFLSSSQVSSGSSKVLTWLVNILTAGGIIDYRLICTPYSFFYHAPITYYLMVFIDPVLYVGWKLIKRTKVVKPSEADLHWDKAAIDAYQDSFNEEPVGFWA